MIHALPAICSTRHVLCLFHIHCYWFSYYSLFFNHTGPEDWHVSMVQPVCRSRSALRSWRRGQKKRGSQWGLVVQTPLSGFLSLLVSPGKTIAATVKLPWFAVVCSLTLWVCKAQKTEIVISLLMSSIVVGYTLDYRPYQRSYSLVKEYIPLTVVWEISILLSYQTYPRHLFVSTQTTLQSMPCSINQTYGGGGHFHLTGQSTEPQRIPKKVCVLNTCLWVCTFLCLEYLLNLFASPKFRCCRLLA